MPVIKTKNEKPACQCRRCKRLGFHPLIGKIPWRRAWQPTPGFLPGKSHRERSLEGYSPWGCRVRHDWSDSVLTVRKREKSTVLPRFDSPYIHAIATYSFVATLFSHYPGVPFSSPFQILPLYQVISVYI